MQIYKYSVMSNDIIVIIIVVVLLLLQVMLSTEVPEHSIIVG